MFAEKFGIEKFKKKILFSLLMNDVVKMQMEKLERILKYKERITQNVKEIIELINESPQQTIKPKTKFDDIMLKNLYEDPIVKNEVKIKQKITDIVHCISCISALWRDDKAPNMGKFINSLNSLFSLCFTVDSPSIKKTFLEAALEYANSLVLPIHENKKWEALIEIDPLLSKIKAIIRSSPNA